MAMFDGRRRNSGPQNIEEFHEQMRSEANFKPAIGKGRGQIVKAKLLGLRVAQETRVMATYNSSLYCFLVEYADGTREVLEMTADDKRFLPMLYFIDM